MNPIAEAVDQQWSNAMNRQLGLVLLLIVGLLVGCASKVQPPSQPQGPATQGQRPATQLDETAPAFPAELVAA